MGPPNAGKSSLLNVLAARDAAIVSPIPGTTRDAVEVSIELEGFKVHMATVDIVRKCIGHVHHAGHGNCQVHHLASKHSCYYFFLSRHKNTPRSKEIMPYLSGDCAYQETVNIYCSSAQGW